MTERQIPMVCNRNDKNRGGRGVFKPLCVKFIVSLRLKFRNDKFMRRDPKRGGRERVTSLNLSPIRRFIKFLKTDFLSLQILCNLQSTQPTIFSCDKFKGRGIYRKRLKAPS